MSNEIAKFAAMVLANESASTGLKGEPTNMADSAEDIATMRVRRGKVSRRATKLRTMPLSVYARKFIPQIRWVQGESLVRIAMDNTLPKTLPAPVILFFPTHYMISSSCDKCPRKHSKRNLRCSASLQQNTPFANGRLFYDFRTGKKVSAQLELTNIVRMYRSPIGIAHLNVRHD